MTLERQLTNGKVRDLLAAINKKTKKKQKNQKKTKKPKKLKKNHYNVVANCTRAHIRM